METNINKEKDRLYTLENQLKDIQEDDCFIPNNDISENDIRNLIVKHQHDAVKKNDLLEELKSLKSELNRYNTKVDMERKGYIQKYKEIGDIENISINEIFFFGRI